MTKTKLRVWNYRRVILKASTEEKRKYSPGLVWESMGLVMAKSFASNNQIAQAKASHAFPCGLKTGALTTSKLPLEDEDGEDRKWQMTFTVLGTVLTLICRCHIYSPKQHCKSILPTKLFESNITVATSYGANSSSVASPMNLPWKISSTAWTIQLII